MRARRAAALFVVVAGRVRSRRSCSPARAGGAGSARADRRLPHRRHHRARRHHRGARDDRVRLRRRAQARHLPHRSRCAPSQSTKDGYDRVYPLDVVSVSGSADTPAQYTVEEDGDNERIKIGDPDRTISGEHTYDIVYRVARRDECVRRPRRAVLERGRQRLGGADRARPPRWCTLPPTSRRSRASPAPSARRWRATPPTSWGADGRVLQDVAEPLRGHDVRRSRCPRARSCRRPLRSSRSGSTSPRRSGSRPRPGARGRPARGAGGDRDLPGVEVRARPPLRRFGRRGRVRRRTAAPRCRRRRARPRRR